MTARKAEGEIVLNPNRPGSLNEQQPRTSADRQVSATDIPGAAYIHVPFCRSKCAYCDFASCARREQDIPLWLTAIKHEIQATARWMNTHRQKTVPLDSVFFGGGTPSLLKPEQVGQILYVLKECFGLSPACEITLEANPGTLGQTDFSRLRQFGVNRLSLGLQAAQDRHLRNLGRIHTVHDFTVGVEQAAAAGFHRISADIMLGLPGQTLADVTETLGLIFSLPIQHVSYYSLILEEGTPFYARYRDHPEYLPDEDLERLLYHETMVKLRAQGYIPYEISNAAQPDERCRHNLVYWNALPYYAFGPAAHSYVDGIRRGNTADLDEWLHIWRDEDTMAFSAVRESETISPAEERKEFMLLGLRLLDGVSFAEYHRRFGRDMAADFSQELLRLQRRSLIEYTDTGIRLTLVGLDLANQVFMEFV